MVEKSREVSHYQNLQHFKAHDDQMLAIKVDLIVSRTVYHLMHMDFNFDIQRDEIQKESNRKTLLKILGVDDDFLNQTSAETHIINSISRFKNAQQLFQTDCYEKLLELDKNVKGLYQNWSSDTERILDNKIKSLQSNFDDLQKSNDAEEKKEIQDDIDEDLQRIKDILEDLDVSKMLEKSSMELIACFNGVQDELNKCNTEAGKFNSKLNSSIVDPLVKAYDANKFEVAEIKEIITEYNQKLQEQQKDIKESECKKDKLEAQLKTLQKEEFDQKYQNESNDIKKLKQQKYKDSQQKILDQITLRLQNEKDQLTELVAKKITVDSQLQEQQKKLQQKQEQCVDLQKKKNSCIYQRAQYLKKKSNIQSLAEKIFVGKSDQEIEHDTTINRFSDELGDIVQQIENIQKNLIPETKKYLSDLDQQISAMQQQTQKTTQERLDMAIKMSDFDKDQINNTDVGSQVNDQEKLKKIQDEANSLKNDLEQKKKNLKEQEDKIREFREKQNQKDKEKGEKLKQFAQHQQQKMQFKFLRIPEGFTKGLSQIENQIEKFKNSQKEFKSQLKQIDVSVNETLKQIQKSAGNIKATKRGIEKLEQIQKEVKIYLELAQKKLAESTQQSQQLLEQYISCGDQIQQQRDEQQLKKAIEETFNKEAMEKQIEITKNEIAIENQITQQQSEDCRKQQSVQRCQQQSVQGHQQQSED